MITPAGYAAWRRRKEDEHADIEHFDEHYWEEADQWRKPGNAYIEPPPGPVIPWKNPAQWIAAVQSREW